MPSLVDELRTAPATIRPFRPDPVRPAALRRAARHAGVAPWRLLTITDPVRRRAIRDAHLPHWRAHLARTGALEVLAADRPAGVARALRAADTFATTLDAVPVHLAILRARDGVLRASLLDDLQASLRAEGFDVAPIPLATAAAPDLHAVLELEADVELHGMLVARPRR
jgi:hypothetical protein